VQPLLREDEDAFADGRVATLVFRLHERERRNRHVVDSLLPEEIAQVSFDLADEGSRGNEVDDCGNAGLAHQLRNPTREDEGLARRRGR
jgi:hypothetical protein